MKKIFAFVLASLMVLSLVPASAFAAVTKCPATHTSTNCDATLLYTAVANCENVGYQAYVCNDCGAQFMDNMKPKTEHKWVSNTKKAAQNIEASCVYQTNGIEWLVCANCEVGYIVDGKEVGYKTIPYDSVDVHDLVLVSGVGCEKLYQCTLCDAKGYIDAENGLLTDEITHTWEFVEVEALPKLSGGKATPGQAVYACEDCVATKKVDILIRLDECTHPSHTDKEEAVKVCGSAPSCTADGYLMVVKCPDCNMHWACKTYEKESVASKITNANCLANHKEMNDHEWEQITDTDKDGDFKDEKLSDKTAIKIGKWGHVNNTPEADLCGEVYICARCKTAATVGHNWKTISGTTIEATCTAKKTYYRQCTTCYTVGSTTSGNALGHKKVTVTLPATCTSAAVTFQYCANGTKCNIKPINVQGKAYRVIDGTLEYFGNVNTSESGHNFDTTLDSNPIVVGTLDKNIYCGDGKITYTYKLCTNEGCPVYGTGNPQVNYPALHDKYITSYTHNFAFSHGGYPAYNSYVKYACKNCTWVSEGKAEPDTTLTVNSFETLEEALVYYGFLKRTTVYNSSTKKFTNTYSVRDMFFKAGFATPEDLKNPARGVVRLLTNVPATCQTAGTDTYVISYTFDDTAWATYVSVTAPKKLHTPGKMTEGKDPTCVVPGTYTTYVCTECGVTFWELDGEQYTTAPIKNPCANLRTEANPQGTLVYRTGSCGDKNGYYECLTCGTYYTDATCATEYVRVNHNYVTILAGVAATCNTVGVPEIRYCADCKALEVNVIYMNGGKEVRVNFITNENIKYKSATATVDFVLNGTNLLSAPVTAIVKTDGTVEYLYTTVEYDEDAKQNVTVVESWSTWPTAVSVLKTESFDFPGTEANEAGLHKGLYTIKVVDGKEVNVLVSDDMLSTQVFFDLSERDVETDFEELDHSKPFFYLVHCEACVYEYIRDFEAAAGGHINSKGKLITDDCADGAGEDRVCVICYNYYLGLVDGTAEEKKEAVKKYAEKYTFGEHTFVNASANTSFTCQSAGYDAKLCTTCNFYFVDSDSYQPANAKKYHQNLKDAIKADATSEIAQACQRGIVADYANNGSVYYVCDVCETELVAPEYTACPGSGVEINLSVDGTEYAPNSYVDVVVSLDSLKGVNAWGVNFSVKYNPEFVEFVSAEFTDLFTNNKANDLMIDEFTRGTSGLILTGAKTAAGIVTVASNSASGVSIKGSNELVVLRFKVMTEQWQIMFETGTVAHGEVGAYGYYEVEHTSNVIGANGKKIPVNYTVNYNKTTETWSNKSVMVSASMFLDFDGDGEVTIVDAFELYYLIENDKYSVLADADNDGDVDTDDLDILYAVLVGETSLEELLKGEEEEKERVVTYDENGYVIYDSAYDFNDDGVLSAYEVAVMTGKIDADLNPNT